MSLRLRRIFGPAVQLSSAIAAGEVRPVWIHAATEGRWKGHPSHPVIEFNADTFAEVIANFRANPQYKVDANGVGCEPVIRLDYEHTSEMDPSLLIGKEGGLPAPGWILELDTRVNEAKGKLELWALVMMGETLWQQTSSGDYRWTSVAIDPNGKDRESGLSIGNVLTSLAITNNPFILDLEDISDSIRGKVAASAYGYCLLEKSARGKVAASAVLCAMSFWGTAETPEEAVVGLRSIFEMPEANAAELGLEVASLERAVVEGTVPTDLEFIFGELRRMLGMRRMATRTEIVAAAKTLVAALVEKESASGGSEQLTSHSPDSTSASGAEALKEASTMKTLAARLAAVLKLSADSDDDAVFDAVKSGLSLRSKVTKKLKLAADADDEAVVDAIEDAEAKKEELDGFGELLNILGAENLTSALAKATKQTETVGKYGAMVEELNALKARLTDSEVKEAEEELSAIAACHKTDDRTKKLLFSVVFSEETKTDGTKVRTLRPGGLAEVRKEYPLPDGASVRQMLTSAVFAGPGGQQLGGAVTGASVPAPTTTLTPSVTPPQESEVLKKVKLCAGANDTMRAVNYLLSQNPAFGERPWAQQISAAAEFLRDERAKAAKGAAA